MIVDSKSQLARLLATENISVEHRKTPTAYFELKSRTLVLPILQEGLTPAIYDLFCGHEVGHALYTPQVEWSEAIKNRVAPKMVINIVEDVRIEKLIKRKYPGLKASFITAYTDLMKRNFFRTYYLKLDAETGKGTPDLNRPKNLDEYNLLDRINLYFKGGPALNIRFQGPEIALVDAVADTETFDEVLNVSKILTDFLVAQNKKPKMNPFPRQSSFDPSCVFPSLLLSDPQSSSFASLLKSLLPTIIQYMFTFCLVMCC